MWTQRRPSCKRQSMPCSLSMAKERPQMRQIRPWKMLPACSSACSSQPQAQCWSCEKDEAEQKKARRKAWSCGFFMTNGREKAGDYHTMKILLWQFTVFLDFESFQISVHWDCDAVCIKRTRSRYGHAVTISWSWCGWKHGKKEMSKPCHEIPTVRKMTSSCREKHFCGSLTSPRHEDV